MLLNIQATMRRIAQGIESIPLHLSLPIIRFDDALGESWGLPFQACSDFMVVKLVRRYRRLLTKSRFSKIFSKQWFLPTAVPGHAKSDQICMPSR